MANVNPVYTTSVTVDPITPTDLVAPIACDSFTIVGLLDASVFYAPGAGQPEIEIVAGHNGIAFGGAVTRNDRMFERQFGGGLTRQVRLTRFDVSDVVGRLRSASGTGPVKVAWQ